MPATAIARRNVPSAPWRSSTARQGRRRLQAAVEPVDYAVARAHVAGRDVGCAAHLPARRGPRARSTCGPLHPAGLSAVGTLGHVQQVVGRDVSAG